MKRHARDEHDRLRWLAGRFDVPGVRAFSRGWLVLEDVGAPSSAGIDAVEAGAILGRALRRLHALPWRSCPFDLRVASVMEAARRNVHEGAVDPSAFDEEHRGADPDALLDLLVASAPTDEDLVVAHGDFCPPNVLLRPDGSTVLIDVGRLGVADRHHDLALVRRELGPAGSAAFDDAYGLSPSEERLAWYRLLDEFF